MSSIPFTISPLAGSLVNVGENVDITATFAGLVQVGDVSQEGSRPRIDFSIDSVSKRAVYQSGDGTKQLLFRYTAASGDERLISLPADASIQGGSLTVAGVASVSLLLCRPAEQKAGGVDTLTPRITQISISPTKGETVSQGGHIDFTVTWSEPVRVQLGKEDDGAITPYLPFRIGPNNRKASYLSGQDSNTLIFRHLVGTLDNKTDIIKVYASDRIDLSGGASITDASGKNASLNPPSNLEGGEIS